MSLEAKVMPAVASVVSFIKEQTTTDLANFSNNENKTKETLTQAQLESICRVVENSIQSNFVRASNQITSVLTEIEVKTAKELARAKKLS